MTKDTLNKKIEFFVEERADFRLRAAPHARQWMDDSPDKYAYRCLPLAIANCYGWEILCTETFEAKWNGGTKKEDIKFATVDGKPPKGAASHFGEGILTFHVNALIKTPPGFDLWVGGPANQIKSHIQALNAVIETDWSPYTFTMNWKFSTPGKGVMFKEDEPIAMIFPVRRGELENFEPVLRSPEDNPELWAEFSAWRESRSTFNKELQEPDSDARTQKWQKAYMQGPDEPLKPAHRSKLRLKNIKSEKKSD